MREELIQWAPYLSIENIAILEKSRFIINCQCAPDRLSLERFLQEHEHYSKVFTRLLCALMSNLTSEDDFRNLCDNLLDETGMHEASPESHSFLYRKMLEKLSVSSTPAPSVQTRHFIEKMFFYVRQSNSIEGLAALCIGAEAIVPVFYDIVKSAFMSLGVPEDDLEFFTVHIGCDEEHAETMKLILDKQVAKSQDDMRPMINSVVKDIFSARVEMLDALTVETKGVCENV